MKNLPLTSISAIQPVSTQDTGEIPMAGKIYSEDGGKRWKIHLHYQGVLYVIRRDPIYNTIFRHKWQAESVAAEIHREIINPDIEFNVNQWLPQRPLSFRKYALAWLENRKKKQEDAGYCNYKSALKKHAIPFFGNADIRKLSAKQIRLYYESLEGAYDTIRLRMGVVKAMLRDAYRDEDIPRVPPFPVLPSNDSKPVEYLTLEQQIKIVDEIPERHRPIFEFGMEFGLRVQEVRAVMKDCIKKGTVEIRRKIARDGLKDFTKTGSLGMRSPKLTTYSKEILKRVEPHLSPYVFVNDKGGPYTGDELNKIWHAAEEKEGIKIKLYNAMRHSLGCQLVDAGVPLEHIRQIYGHKSIKMTERYLRRQITQVANDALEARRTKIIPYERAK